MKETVHLFPHPSGGSPAEGLAHEGQGAGAGVQMVGLLTEPVGVEPEVLAGRPVVLFWNAGLLHRIGPNRLWVDLARRLADLGFCCFRFDLTGLGDSATRPGDGRSEDERAAEDIREAIDFVTETFEATGVVLVGLCSGADQAHPVAVADPRVRGVVSLDGIGYRTLGFYLRHARGRLEEGGMGWLVEAATRRLRATRDPTGAPTSGSGSEPTTETFERSFPPRRTCSAELQQLLDRGTRLLVVHTGGFSDGYYNGPRQFWETFRSLEPRDLVEVHYLEESDHTYTLSSDREQLMGLIGGWLRGVFGPGSPGGSMPVRHERGT